MRGPHTDTGYLLYRLGPRPGQLFNAPLADRGPLLRHHAFVRYLATAGEAPQREPGERLGYDPSAIVGLVDDLERLGFAERRPAPGDRRSRVVVLTEAGREPLRLTDHAGHRGTDELLGALDPQARATVHAPLLRAAEPDEG